MKRICLVCERTSPDSNVFCQEAYCPAEMCPYIFDYGEWLGDIEITRTVSVLRSSALYEARHAGQTVLLKVAHPGVEHTERLKREALFLRDTASRKERDVALPQLLPPYANASVAQEPYGRAMYREHLLYYCVFAHFQGNGLRDVLLKNPQLWIFHVGWIVTSLAATVAFLQNKGRYHFAITPEALLVRFNADAAPDVLLIDLGIATDREQLARTWYPEIVPPAYTAPELIDAAPQPNYATDVYGIGLVLYELLVGTPPYPYKLRSDKDVYAMVKAGQIVRMTRVEDVREVAEIASSAVSPDPRQRQKSAAELAGLLLKTLGDAPAKRRSSWPAPRTTLMVTAALLAVAFIITLGATMMNFVR